MTIMIGMRRTGDIMQSDEDDDSQEEIDEAVEFWDNETPEHSDGEAGPTTEELVEEDEWQQNLQEAQSDGGYNADEEYSESEDMPGDSADERSESYDNWDYDAADG